jgi:hypothetical protein
MSLYVYGALTVGVAAGAAAVGVAASALLLLRGNCNKRHALRKRCAASAAYAAASSASTCLL